MPYTPQDPPPGIPGAFIAVLGALPPAVGGPILLPKVAATYLNLGPLRQDGLEVSLDQLINNDWSFTANYSYQKTPKILDAAAGQIPYPTREVGIPSKNRFNAQLSYGSKRFFGNVAVNYTDKAFWTDVLDSTYHGETPSFTMLNATLGAHWADGKITTSLKGTNLTNETIQQHIYGDYIKMGLVGEVRINVK